MNNKQQACHVNVLLDNFITALAWGKRMFFVRWAAEPQLFDAAVLSRSENDMVYPSDRPVKWE